MKRMINDVQKGGEFGRERGNQLISICYLPAFIFPTHVRNLINKLNETILIIGVFESMSKVIFFINQLQF